MDKITQEQYDGLTDAVKAIFKPGPPAEDGSATYVPSSEEGAVLGSRLKERESTIAAQAKQLEDYKARLGTLEQRWAGVDPEDAKKAMEAKAAIEAKKYVDKGDIPGLLAQHEERWKQTHAKEVEHERKIAARYRKRLEKVLISDRFKDLGTAGGIGDGDKRQILPTVTDGLMPAAEALFYQTYQPKIEEVKNGDGVDFRAVVPVDGLNVPLEDFFVNNFLPAWRDKLFTEPKHEGGKTANVTPSTRGGSNGTPRQISAADHDAVNANLDAIAKGEAVVVD